MVEMRLGSLQLFVIWDIRRIYLVEKLKLMSHSVMCPFAPKYLLKGDCNANINHGDGATGAKD